MGGQKRDSSKLKQEAVDTRNLKKEAEGSHLSHAGDSMPRPRLGTNRRAPQRPKARTTGARFVGVSLTCQQLVLPGLVLLAPPLKQ